MKKGILYGLSHYSWFQYKKCRRNSQENFVKFFGAPENKLKFIFLGDHKNYSKKNFKYENIITG